MTKENKGKVFVYGTLKIGGRLAPPFNEVRLSSTKGTIQGKLYNVPGAWFPAVKLGGEDVVHGELHEFDKFSEVLARMDRMEGYREEDHTHSLYLRKEAEVITVTGEKEIAFVYEFNREVPEDARVMSGDWPIE